MSSMEEISEGPIGEGEVSRWQTPELGSGFGSSSQGQANGEALQQALKKGFEEGRRQTLELNRADFEEQQKRFEELISAFEQPLGVLDSQVVGELSQLSVKIAELILHAEINIDPAVVERLAEEALSAVDKPESTRVRLNPDDFDFLNGSGFLERWELISFEADAELSRGSVLIRSPDTRVDASVEARLRQVLHDLLGDD